ncbi:MAG TPA: methionyl-tRNA formyltransferase [Hyphomicrobium sp.]|nr:methionyl-tRNA formyltransferase [Hyphomicrobium sp.]
MALRLIFMGTPEFSVPVLDAILKAGHTVVAVYSQPPRPAGRGMAEQPSPVHRFALDQGLTVLTPLNFKAEEDRAAFSAHDADAAVVVAYGLILPEAVLAAPRHGCFNVHASKLPRWRGAAPIQRAIMSGDTETAVMVMRMERGLDTGPVCLTRTIAITPETTAGALHDVLSDAGARLMVDALAGLEAGTLTAAPQATDGVTYAAKIDKAEAKIDFAHDAAAVVAHIHGLSPFPGAWFEVAHGGKVERVKVLRAVTAAGGGDPGNFLDDQLTIACGRGAIRLVEVQRAGKRPAMADEFLRGFAIPAP